MSEMKAADIMYGRMRRLKLTPAARIEMISELLANREVKKMTAIKTNNGENRFAK